MSHKVTAHKAGSSIIYKPHSLYAKAVKDEIFDLLHLNPSSRIFNNKVDESLVGTQIYVEEKRARTPIEDVLSADKHHHFYNLISAFYKYGVEFHVDPSLMNYLKKAARREVLENTPNPTVDITTEVALFDRCGQGTIIKCIKDYTPSYSKTPIFLKDNSYIVVESSVEADKVIINTDPYSAEDVTINYNANGSIYEWTCLHPAMDNWFDDSIDLDLGKDITQVYPERIAEMRKKLAGLNFPKNSIYKHVEEDAVIEAIRYGTLNCKLMRMGKTSEAITVCELWGSKKIAVISTKNIVLFWKKEFERLKIKDYVVVKKLADLEKPAKYYLMTYSYIRSMKDSTSKARKDKINYLKKSYYEKRTKVGAKDYVDKIEQFNTCPHCKDVMVRPNNVKDTVVQMLNPFGTSVTTIEKAPTFTQKRGYMCINKKCTWTSDSSKAKGAAWHNSKPVKHKGGYVDFGLAAHSRCDEEAVKHHRQCPSCKETDGTWKPPIYRRFKDKFTAVIADEIHNAKDRSTLTAQALFSMRAKRRMGLTGTPQSNSVMDIYWIFHWLFGGRLKKSFPFFMKEGEKAFETRYCSHMNLEKPSGEIDANGKAIMTTVKKRVPYLQNAPDFWKFTSPKVIRRTYKDPLYLESLAATGQKLPKSEIKTIYSAMHPSQTKLMLAALQDFKKTFLKMVDDATSKNNQVNEAIVLGKMSALKMIATCPERINEKFGKEVYDGPAGGGKITDILTLAFEKLAAGEKIVLLSDFIGTQKLLEEKLKDYNPIRFLTTWDTDEREEAFDKFANDPTAKAFIAGTRAINAGVDLSPANSVFCCDLLWSPALQMQAWSRILAPRKEERNCDIFLFSSKHSIDENIYETFYSKMVAAEQAFDRRIVARKSQTLDIKFFAQRVLEDEALLRLDLGFTDDSEVVISNIDMEVVGEWREA